MSTDAVHARLAAIRGAIAEARKSVAEGGDIDLAGIEDAVGTVCADISAAGGGADREAIEATIRALMADFDALAGALERQHRQAVAGSGLDAAARSAYGADRDPDDGAEGGD